MSDENDEILMDESIKIEDEIDPFEEVSNYNDVSENFGETHNENFIYNENFKEEQQDIVFESPRKRKRLKKNYSEFEDDNFWSCEICGKSLSRQEHLTRHINTVHGSKGKKLVVQFPLIFFL